MANNLTSPLPLNLNATDLYSEYKHWMNSYLIYELASGVSTKKDDVKRATLLHCLGPQVQRIFFNLPEEKDTYEKAKEALTKYFTPQKNIVSERFKFRQRKQNTDENIDSYVIALRELVKSCEFGNLEEDMIRDQIIEKCYNRQLKEKLLQQDNLNLQRTIEISRMFETAKEEFRVLTNEDMTSINRVNYKNNFQAANESTVKGSKAHNVYHQKGSTSKVSAPNLEECYRCGLTTHPPYKCGARNMKCTFCNKMGHLNRVCRNKNKYKNIEGKKRNIQNISENNEDSDEYTFFLGSDNKESIYIDGKEIKMTIDTGSDTTFIGLENLKNIFPKSQMPTLNGTERKFYAYGQTSPLPCCGYFFADVSWGERSIKEQIFVIEGKAEPILGKKASFELEIIKRGTKIRNIQQEVIPKDIYNLIQENMNLFQGQGNVKGYSQKITLKENVTPVAQRCRHFPYKMVEAINQELDKMIEDGIIEEVHEASEWISNIVAVPKKGTEEIRLCVDLREVNKAIVRERYPIPTVDNILQALQGAKFFAKLDAKKGFWQIELDEKSRPLTTFITPRGCYRFCKIPFGLCSAPEAFQKAMNSILSHLEGVLCYIDDVIVYAQSIEQLDQRLKKVFERFQQVGLKLNKSKCKFALNELEILGHIVSKDGIRPDPKKIESVLSFSKPENVDSLKSFLGTCGFLRKFIPDFSKLAEPLNNLTRKDIKWKWSKKEEDSFRKLKEALTKNPCLAYFDMNAPTEVIADASPVGLGAVLLQRQNDGSKKPVAYASRSLTNVERRYSQIEKEALGCVWAVEHFNDYLWGNKFVLKTDHKPLIYMLNPKKATVLPPRIERLSWRLQPYDYEIEYLKGKQNIADIFSRKPLTNISCENIVDDYVEKVLSIFSEEMKAISLNDIKKQSEADPFFKILTKIIQTGNWPYQIDDDELKILHKFKEELSVYDNLILKGKRIVIPTDLRRNILDLAHETHQGIARTKQILREKYYWPNMDKDIERRIKNCYICEVNQPLRHDQPLTTIPIPPRPWYKVGVDLVGPIASKYILTLIDYYSSFPEAIIINDISSKTIISKLKEIFARYGFPIEIVSDNGLQFVSKDTEQFFMKSGIKHIRVSPYYPKSNGKIERFHRYLKKQLISVKLQGKDWKEELQCVLMAYRSTPHPSTGKTPALLLFSREIRNKLNDINDNDSLMDKEVMEHNQAYKERMKKYADSKNKALPHDFKKGNIVYVANTEMKSKLTPNYDNQRFIILETISPNSFKLVNTETGSFIIRNAKHLRHANVLQDFNKGIDLNTTLIKTPEIRMELPSTSRYLPEQEATLEDIVPEEQIAISDMDCLYPNESPNENENKTVITRSGRQIHKTTYTCWTVGPRHIGARSTATTKQDGWMDGPNKMVGWMDQTRWLDGLNKQDGWMDGPNKMVGWMKQTRWLDGPNKMVGWMDRTKWLDGWTKQDGWMDGPNKMVGWMDQTRWLDGWTKQGGWVDGPNKMVGWMDQTRWLDGWTKQDGWMDETNKMVGWMDQTRWLDGWTKQDGWMDGPNKMVGWMDQTRWLDGLNKQDGWMDGPNKMVGWMKQTRCWMDGPNKMVGWMDQTRWLDGWTKQDGWMDGPNKMVGWMDQTRWLDGWTKQDGWMDGPNKKVGWIEQTRWLDGWTKQDGWMDETNKMVGWTKQDGWMDGPNKIIQMAQNQPPETFDFSTPNEWPKWRKRFERYLVVSGMKKKEEADKIDLFMYLMGDRADDIFRTFKFEKEEEATKLDSVLKAFGSHFCVRKNIIYERAKFNSRIQEDREPVDEFITSLYKLADSCEFEGLHEQLIRDRIVVGVRDKALSERMQLDSELTLEKAVKLVRQQEAVRQQQVDLQRPSTSQKVNQVKFNSKKQSPKQQQQPSRKREKSAKTRSRCPKCGGFTHREGQACRAEGQKCNLCSKTGHFANCYPDKQAKTAEVKAVSELDEEIGFLLEVSAVEDSSNLDNDEDECRRRWTAEIQVNGKKVKFKLDSQADVTCVPLCLFKKIMGQQRLVESDINIRAAEFSELQTDWDRSENPYEIKLKPGAKPYAVHTPRRVPIPLMEKLKTRLEELEKAGIIAQVNVATEWCAPTVIAGKPNGDIRLCVDLSRLNEHVQREVHPMPVVEHMLGQLGEARFFSKLDANSGFHQIPLSPDCQHLTTFITPFGRYKYCRMPFGISLAPEYFQKVMSIILQGMDGVMCYLDDILIFASDSKTHDRILRLVLRKLKEAKVTLNKAKCVFGVPRINFLGHILDEDGIRPDPAKIEAVAKMPAPTDVHGVRRFLGMVNHLGRFVENLSEIVAPLNQLLVKGQDFVWDCSQERAFRKLKELLTTQPILAAYDVRKPTMVSSDASSYGLGAVLKQEGKNGIWRPVAYSSRTMTPTEKRYAQIEKEALAITWACERFQDFLLGKRFRIETDHKPLIPLFSTKELSSLTPRLQRFRMRMMRFGFEIVHIPGKELLDADALSRQPLLTTEGGENERQTSAHINAVLSSITDKDEMLTKIFEAQQEDTTLKAVVNYLEQGWPDKKKMSPALLSYWHVKDELGVQNRLLMRGCRLVIPARMKLEILDKLHAGHFGITKTRLRARETVWWPGISEEIAETVRKCSVCIQEAVSKHEPLIPTNFPTRPWQKIGMDLFKFENKWHLVVIDYYSRFPEVVQLDRLTANVVVRSCKSIFARHGIPETVVSDNGTQFGAAREFANFARQYGFTHVTSSPRFPQSNGMAEAGVKIAKLILKKNQDPSLGLLKYRSTPLENGYSPAELLMGRKLRTTLPIAPENLNPKLVDSQTLKRKEGRRRKDMKSRYDRRCGATDMEELSEGDTVWITDMRTWGIVKQKASTPRSYMVDTPVGTLRRNRFHLRKGVTVQYPADPSTPTFSGEELVENEKTPVVDHPSNDSEDGQIRTRNGGVWEGPHSALKPDLPGVACFEMVQAGGVSTGQVGFDDLPSRVDIT
ncbi:K02A2.6-like, partial [Cordylochernes scorpioides]